MPKVYLIALGLLVLVYIPGISPILLYGGALVLGIIACFIPATSFLLESRVLKVLKNTGWAVILVLLKRLSYVALSLFLLFLLLAYTPILNNSFISIGFTIIYVMVLIAILGGSLVLITAYWPFVLLFLISLYFIPVLILFALFMLPMTIVTIVRMIMLFNSETPLSLVVKEHARLSADQFKARLEGAVLTVKYKNPYSKIKMNYEESLARELSSLSAAKREMLREAMMQLDFEDAYFDVKEFIPQYQKGSAV